MHMVSLWCSFYCLLLCSNAFLYWPVKYGYAILPKMWCFNDWLIQFRDHLEIWVNSYQCYFGIHKCQWLVWPEQKIVRMMPSAPGHLYADNPLVHGSFGCNIKDRYLEHLQWYWPQVNARIPYWWLVNGDSGNGLVSLDPDVHGPQNAVKVILTYSPVVSLGRKPLPEPMFTIICVIIWHAQATIIWSYWMDDPGVNKEIPIIFCIHWLNVYRVWFDFTMQCAFYHAALWYGIFQHYFMIM